MLRVVFVVVLALPVRVLIVFPSSRSLRAKKKRVLGPAISRSLLSKTVAVWAHVVNHDEICQRFRALRQGVPTDCSEQLRSDGSKSSINGPPIVAPPCR